MKTPIDMLHDIAAQVSEGNTLLELIYKNTEEMNEETDSGLACLIRSFDKTRETAYTYIDELIKNKNTVSPPPAGIVSILPMVFLTHCWMQRKPEKLLVYISTPIFPIRIMTILNC